MKLEGEPGKIISITEKQYKAHMNIAALQKGQGPG
jgi:hypothetical protein